MVTAEERAYSAIRALILEQSLPVGEFLSQRLLAKQVGTTVVPLREALRRLAADGLIESVPRWGVRIPVDTEEQVRDRYFMRETLELAAVRRIRERRDPAVQARLQEQARRCDDVGGRADGDTRQFAQEHYAFHALFVESSGSPLLAASLNRLNLRSLMWRNAARVWGKGIDRVGPYHQRLVEAVFSVDEAAAMEAMRGHIRQGMENELIMLRESRA